MKGAQERNGGKRSIFHGHGEKYDITSSKAAQASASDTRMAQIRA